MFGKAKKERHKMKIVMEVDFDVETLPDFPTNNNDEVKALFLAMHPGRSKITSFRVVKDEVV